MPRPRPKSRRQGPANGPRALKATRELLGLVGLAELFAAVLIAGVSATNAAIPTGVFLRLRDARFLLLAGANATFAVLGGIWAWGQLPLGPPSWTAASLPVLAIALLVSLLLLATTLWPRHA